MEVYRTFIVKDFEQEFKRLYQCNDGLGNETWFIEKHSSHFGPYLEKLMPYQAEYLIKNSK
jgi:hypothetical protein